MRKKSLIEMLNPGRSWVQYLPLPALRGIATLAILVLAAGMVSCSSDSDPSPADQGTMPISVGGYVFKGAVQAATVYVRTITATGDAGSVVAGPFTTDATGRWSGEVPGGTAGFHAITATGGSYTDESTGGTVNLTSEMLGLIEIGQDNTGNVTPVTHAIFVNGTYRVQQGASISAAFSGAIDDITAALGFDPTTLAPVSGGSSVSPAASTNMDIYNAILAGFSELLADNPSLGPAFDNAETWEIVKAVALDMTDGKLDSIDILGNGILIDDGSGTFIQFPPLDANDISNLVDAAVAWAAVHLPGVTIPPIDLSVFGDPGYITPGDDWLVSGTLTVTGSDAQMFGTTFTPTGVMAGLGLGKVESFTFYVGDITHFVSAGFDGTTDPGTLSNVAAGNVENFWLSAILPVPGATISLTAPYTVNFVDVTLLRVGSESTIILNGSLTATPQ